MLTLCCKSAALLDSTSDPALHERYAPNLKHSISNPRTFLLGDHTHLRNCIRRIGITPKHSATCKTTLAKTSLKCVHLEASSASGLPFSLSLSTTFYRTGMQRKDASMRIVIETQPVASEVNNSDTALYSWKALYAQKLRNMFSVKLHYCINYPLHTHVLQRQWAREQSGGHCWCEPP